MPYRGTRRITEHGGRTTRGTVMPDPRSLAGALDAHDEEAEPS